MKKVRSFVAVYSLTIGAAICAPNAQAAIDSATLLEKCKPLLDAVNGALDMRKKKTAIEAGAISGGGSLSEASCVDNLLDFEFDSFMNVGGFDSLLGGLFDTLKNDVQDQLKQMTCDFADDLKAQSDDFLSCTANMSVDLSMAAGLSAPTLESCLGTGLSGNGYDFNYSGGEGSSSIGTRLGGDFNLGNGNQSSNSGATVIDSLQNKVEDLNNMGGR